MQFIEGPKRAESVLRLGGYAEVELLPPETLERATLVNSSPVETAVGDDRATDLDESDDDEEELVR